LARDIVVQDSRRTVICRRHEIVATMKIESKRSTPAAVVRTRRPKGRRTDGVDGQDMNLQQLREYVRKTQGDVARKAAVTQPQLSRIEGRRDHLVSTLRKYVRALGGDIRVVAHIGVEQIVLRDV
jgi:DNA-binding XRE family transcriptional regulator